MTPDALTQCLDTQPVVVRRATGLLRDAALDTAFADAETLLQRFESVTLATAFERRRGAHRSEQPHEA